MIERDNVRDHRVGTEIIASICTRKSGLWSFRMVCCCLSREPERSSERTDSSLKNMRRKIKSRE